MSEQTREELLAELERRRDGEAYLLNLINGGLEARLIPAQENLADAWHAIGQHMEAREGYIGELKDRVHELEQKLSFPVGTGTGTDLMESALTPYTSLHAKVSKQDLDVASWPDLDDEGRALHAVAQRFDFEELEKAVHGWTKEGDSPHGVIYYLGTLALAFLDGATNEQTVCREMWEALADSEDTHAKGLPPHVKAIDCIRIAQRAIEAGRMALGFPHDGLHISPEALVDALRGIASAMTQEPARQLVAVHRGRTGAQRDANDETPTTIAIALGEATYRVHVCRLERDPYHALGRVVDDAKSLRADARPLVAAVEGFAKQITSQASRLQAEMDRVLNRATRTVGELQPVSVVGAEMPCPPYKIEDLETRYIDEGEMVRCVVKHVPTGAEWMSRARKVPSQPGKARAKALQEVMAHVDEANRREMKAALESEE